MYRLLPDNLREPWRWRCWRGNQSATSLRRSGHARSATRVTGILVSSVEPVEARSPHLLLRQRGHSLRRQRTQDRSLPQRRQCTEHLGWKQPRKRSRVYLALKLQCMQKMNKRRHSWWRWNQHWHSCRRRSRLTSSLTLYRCRKTLRHCGTRLQKLETASPWQLKLPRPVHNWTERTNASATWRKYRGALKRNSQNDEARQPKPKPRFRNWRKNWLKNFQVRRHRWTLTSAQRRRSPRPQSIKRFTKWSAKPLNSCENSICMGLGRNEENTYENDLLNLKDWLQQSKRENKTIRSRMAPGAVVCLNKHRRQHGCTCPQLLPFSTEGTSDEKAKSKLKVTRNKHFWTIVAGFIMVTALLTPWD